MAEAKAKIEQPKKGEAKAVLRYLRVSPRKVRSVVDAVRGLPLPTALAELAHLRRGSAPAVAKLLRSAAANAKDRAGVGEADLTVSEIRADMGPVLKRYRPRAFGRATGIRKGTTHVQVTLTYDAAKASAAEPAKPAKAEEVKTVTAEEAKAMAGSQDDVDQGAQGAGQSGERGGVARKIFQRKTG